MCGLNNHGSIPVRTARHSVVEATAKVRKGVLVVVRVELLSIGDDLLADVWRERVRVRSGASHVPCDLTTTQRRR